MSRRSTALTVHVFAGCLCAVLSISYHIYESFPRNLHDRMLSADQVRSSQKKKKSSVGSPRRSLFWTILSKSACSASLSPSQPFSALLSPSQLPASHSTRRAYVCISDV